MAGEGNVTREMMLSLYGGTKPFMTNFAQMKTDAGTAHGKVFEEHYFFLNFLLCGTLKIDYLLVVFENVFCLFLE